MKKQKTCAMEFTLDELQTLIDIVGRTNDAEDPGSLALYDRMNGLLRMVLLLERSN